MPIKPEPRQDLTLFERKSQIEKMIHLAKRNKREDAIEKLEKEELKIMNLLYKKFISKNDFALDDEYYSYLQDTLEYFENIEEYEKCNELMNVLKLYNVKTTIIN